MARSRWLFVMPTLILVSLITGHASGQAPQPFDPGHLQCPTTDPATNQVTGSPNRPVDIPGGQSQTFSLSLMKVPIKSAWGSAVVGRDPERGQGVPRPRPLGIAVSSGLIMLAVLPFNVIGDGLRDAFDPRAEMR